MTAVVAGPPPTSTVGGGAGPRMRVAVIGPARFPLVEPFAGGLEAHTHALVLGLRRRGHAVTVFAAPGSDPRLAAVDLAVDTFTSSTAARADVGAPPERWMREHHAYLDLMLGLRRRTGRRFDVVHDNSLHHLPIAMADVLDEPVVTTLHTPPVPWLESAAALASERHRFVAVSSATARSWRHALHAEVVPNAVDTDAWYAGPGGRRALWSGRLVPEKAPHEAVLAARAAGVAIDLAGPVLDRAYFEQQVRPLLAEDARYLGHLGRAALRHVAAHSCVAVVTPAWEEPFGLVAIEALSSGTPVAAYARGALPEILADGVGALADPGDVASLARAIRTAARLDRGAAREHAVRHYSHDVMLTAYERVYARADQGDLVA